MKTSIVYLLHFYLPYKHARHYLGSTDDLTARLHQHATGRGARLLAVASAAGIHWTLVRAWPGDRTRERKLKNHHRRALCPLCTPRSFTRALTRKERIER